MFLQSLELVGFKSFAPKTTLRFHRGVTAIVGPIVALVAVIVLAGLFGSF